MFNSSSDAAAICSPSWIIFNLRLFLIVSIFLVIIIFSYCCFSRVLVKLYSCLYDIGSCHILVSTRINVRILYDFSEEDVLQ